MFKSHELSVEMTPAEDFFKFNPPGFPESLTPVPRWEGVYFFWNNLLTSRAFCQKHMSSWTFLVKGQISSNLLKEASATWQHALLSTNIAFYDIFALACPKIKIFSGFSTESNLHTSLGFLVFLGFFFHFPFSLFLIFLLQWLTFYWACFHFKKFWERIIKVGNFYHGVAMFSLRKSCSEFFSRISKHYCAHFRLHWANNFDLGIISLQCRYYFGAER